MSATTAIFGTYVLAEGADGAQQVLRDHWVLLEGDRIAAVTPSRPKANCVFDRPGRLIVPGLLNLHNHAFSEAVARTHSEDGGGSKGNESIVYTVLLPLTKRGLDILTPQERMAIARLGVLQILKGGATTVMEPFRAGLSEMFDASEEMGLRFYGAPYLFSTSDAKVGEDGQVVYKGDDGEKDLATWSALYERWQGKGEGRIGLAMSPHATDTCGPDLLRACAAKARELGVPLTTHLAQSEREVEVIQARYGGKTPAEYLDWLGLLKDDLLAAHCIASSDSDLALMAQRGTKVLNCPRVFARRGRTAAFSRFASFGIDTLVATDGYNIDLIGELNAAAMISKLTAGDGRVATAPELIASVTAKAAKAIGRNDLGRLVPGAKADITVLDMTHPHMQPCFDPLRALIALGNRSCVAQVLVDGKVLIDEGRLATGHEDTIVAQGVAAVERIWQLPEAVAAFSGRA